MARNEIDVVEELEELLREPVRRFEEPEPVNLRPLVSYLHNQLF